VSDLVDGIYRLLMSAEHGPINIGNPHEVTIGEVAKEVIEMIGSKSRLIFEPLPVDDPKVRQPDITRAHTLLGWEPKVGLEEGLTSTIAYFRRKLDRRP
jgi:dTDP-glucose 4,6-dehydratase